MPFLGILGNEIEAMAWGTPTDKVQPYMPLLGRCVVLDDVGHFAQGAHEEPRFLEEGRADFEVGVVLQDLATGLQHVIEERNLLRQDVLCASWGAVLTHFRGVGSGIAGAGSGSILGSEGSRRGF